MPTAKRQYVKEHHCQIIPQDQFRAGTFSTSDRIDDKTGKKYFVLKGKFCGCGKQEIAIQGFRYPKKDWTEKQAYTHCRKFGGNKANFFAAVERKEPKRSKAKSKLKTPKSAKKRVARKRK